MPKYYRFRALTPTRKPKRNQNCFYCQTDNEKEIVTKEIIKTEANRNWLDNLTVACSPVPSWYLRRTSWRQSSPLMGLPRQLSMTVRTFHFGNRPVFVIKM